MIYGIESTTDLNNPETKIIKFASEAKARRWLAAGSGGFAWPGAARDDLPPSQQNFHRRFRSAYRMPTGWRLLERDINAVFARQGYRGWAEAKARVIVRAAVEEIK